MSAIGSFLGHLKALRKHYVEHGQRGGSGNKTRPLGIWLCGSSDIWSHVEKELITAKSARYFYASLSIDFPNGWTCFLNHWL